MGRRKKENMIYGQNLASLAMVCTWENSDSPRVDAVTGNGGNYTIVNKVFNTFCIFDFRHFVWNEIFSLNHFWKIVIILN